MTGSVLIISKHVEPAVTMSAKLIAKRVGFATTLSALTTPRFVRIVTIPLAQLILTAVLSVTTGSALTISKPVIPAVKMSVNRTE
jgi:hypothetical protein